MLSTHHIYCIFKSISEVIVLDDERDILDFSNSSNDDFQKFLIKINEVTVLDDERDNYCSLFSHKNYSLFSA